MWGRKTVLAAEWGLWLLLVLALSLGAALALEDSVTGAPQRATREGSDVWARPLAHAQRARDKEAALPKAQGAAAAAAAAASR
jgi:hypothetical protein